MIYAFFSFLVLSIILLCNCDNIDREEYFEYSIITTICIFLTVFFCIGSLQ